MSAAGSPSRVRGKRAFDLFFASLLLTVTAPVLAVSAWLVRRTSPGPALYRATRVGRDGRLFTMFKLRSMYAQPGEATSLTTGLSDPRVTPVGRRLRSYKIDELPQLINVLRGEMSLVGPRPEVEECVALYTPEQRAILTIRPGITDLASVEFSDLARVVGESDDPHQVYLDQVFDEKNRLRLEYVQRQSWRLDLSILARTSASIVGLGRGTRHR